MKTRLLTCLLVAALPVVLGCTTLVDQRRRADMRERSDMENVKSELRRLREQVDGMASAQEDLSREIEALRAGTGEGNADLRARLESVERAVENAAASRDRLKREMVDSLSKKVTEIVRAPARASATPVATGYEHVVRAGETLSEIAAAYKVSVGAVIRANSLKNPDALKVGQKLFIPE